MKKINFKKSFVSARSSRGGFTLIELLVVVAIIAILSSLVLAYLNSARGKSANSKIISQVGQMTPQGFLYSGGTSGGGVITPVNTGIANPAASGTAPYQLFNATTLSLNSLYSLGSTLPTGTYIYYGWNGANPNLAGAWFFAAATSTGAFCNDHKGSKKSYTVAGPVDTLAEFTTGFPNAVAGAGNYRCD